MLLLVCRFIEFNFISCAIEDRTLIRNFGLHIRDLRRQKGLSQEAFADVCDLHRTYIGSIERGEKAITIATANKLAKALDIPLSEIFSRVEDTEVAE